MFLFIFILQRYEEIVTKLLRNCYVFVTFLLQLAEPQAIQKGLRQWDDSGFCARGTRVQKPMAAHESGHTRHNLLNYKLYKRFTAVTAVYSSNGGTTLRLYTADYSSKHARHNLLKCNHFRNATKKIQL